MDPFDEYILQLLNKKVEYGQQLSETQKKLRAELKTLQMENASPVPKRSDTEIKETNIPFHVNMLDKLGFENRGERYILYGTMSVFILNAYPEWKKAYYYEKWCKENDSILKDIYLIRSQFPKSLLKYGEEAGLRYVTHARNFVKFWSVFPLSYISFITLRGGYRYCKNIFYSHENNK